MPAADSPDATMSDLAVTLWIVAVLAAVLVTIGFATKAIFNV